MLDHVVVSGSVVNYWYLELITTQNSLEILLPRNLPWRFELAAALISSWGCRSLKAAPSTHALQHFGGSA
jgi:hypothetical protein